MRWLRRNPSREPDPQEALPAAEVEAIRAKIATVPYWYHRIELAPGAATPGGYDPRGMLTLLELPEDCSGMRALDIGAADGFFSFELERRGAEVLALDYRSLDHSGFRVAREVLQSNVRHEVGNVYDLTPERYGQFDIVLFLGVLYHLRNPLLALDKIWSVCRGRVWVESHVIDNAFLDPKTGEAHSLSEIAPNLASSPIMQFYPQDALNRDFTNYWAPNMVCLRAMLEEANFIVESEFLAGARGGMRCRAGDDPETNRLREEERTGIR